MEDGSRPFRVYCDASIDGFGATLEQEQPDGSVGPVAYVSRATLDSEIYWTPLDLEAGSIVYGRSSAFEATHGVRCFAFSRTTSLWKNIARVRDHNARVQRLLEYLTRV